MTMTTMYLLIFQTGESIQHEIDLFATQPVDRLAGSTRWLVRDAPRFSCARRGHRFYPTFHGGFGGGGCDGLRMIIETRSRRIVYREDGGPLGIIPDRRRRRGTTITAGTYPAPEPDKEALY